MFLPSIFAEVIPKYKLYIDSILLKDKELIQKAIENGTTSPETSEKLSNLYLEFVKEYNLYNIDKAQNASQQLITDISDLECEGIYSYAHDVFDHYKISQTTFDFMEKQLEKKDRKYITTLKGEDRKVEILCCFIDQSLYVY